MGAPSVRYEVNVPEIVLSVRRTVAIGLIVNEAATNAVKHGFGPPSDARFDARFDVAMHGEDQDGDAGECVLRISNNGRRWKDSFDPAAGTTLGLQLIHALVHQMNGTFELQRDPQTTLVIRFPADDPVSHRK